MKIRLAHAWSSDLGIPWTAPYDAPLLARGWEIWNITPDGPYAREPLPAGTHWLPHRLSRGMQPREDLIGAAQLVKYFLSHRFHIVHTHAIKVGLVARVLATAVRVPILVHTMHGLAYSLDTPEPKRTLHALAEKIASLDVDAIFAQSHEDADTIVATGVVPRERIVWVGNGINLDRFDRTKLGEDVRRSTRAQLGLADDDVLFLMAGRLVLEKGVVELMEAAIDARKTDPRVRLAIAGEIDHEKAEPIDAQTLDRARDSGVLLLGRRSDMPELLAACDVVTLMSWREGLPRFLMEGAVMGKPLLASDARGCREVVVDGVNGRLVPVRDVSAIARAMLDFTRDTELRARFGDENARRGPELYDIDNIVPRVTDTYDRLIDAKRDRIRV